MMPHIHHWDSIMVFEENARSLFPSNLFIQPGNNKNVVEADLSEIMASSLSKCRNICK